MGIHLTRHEKVAEIWKFSNGISMDFFTQAEPNMPFPLLFNNMHESLRTLLITFPFSTQKESSSQWEMDVDSNNTTPLY